MPTLTLKNLPASLHHSLKQNAKEQGRSLNAHVIHLLEIATAEQARRSEMRRRRRDLEEFVNSLPSTTDSTELIREARWER